MRALFILSKNWQPFYVAYSICMPRRWCHLSPGEHPEAEECLEDVVDEHGLSALVGRPLPHVPDAGVPAQ